MPGNGPIASTTETTKRGPTPVKVTAHPNWSKRSIQVLEYPGYVTSCTKDTPVLSSALQQQLKCKPIPPTLVSGNPVVAPKGRQLFYPLPIVGSSPLSSSQEESGVVGDSLSCPTLALHLSQGPFAHPIIGKMIPTTNLLLKVVRRRRVGNYQEQGKRDASYSASIEGVITSTGRWRAMADYQYTPPTQDHMYKLRQAMLDLNADYMESEFRLQADSDPTPMPILPPAVFSNTQIPFDYNYTQNPTSYLVKVSSSDATLVGEGANPDATGTTTYKYVNRNRAQFSTAIRHDPAKLDVPEAPPERAVRQAELKGISQESIDRLKAIFKRRPIWSRPALLNQLSASDRANARYLFPLAAYVVATGPWRDCWVRYGVDPRVSPDLRFYQLLDLRFMKLSTLVGGGCTGSGGIGRNHAGRRTLLSKEPITTPDASTPASHEFDGATLPAPSTWTSALPYNHLQLCDILDPELRAFIYKPDRPLPRLSDERSGWFPRKVLDCVREGIKRKVSQLLLAKGWIQPSEARDLSEERWTRMMKEADEVEDIAGMVNPLTSLGLGGNVGDDAGRLSRLDVLMRSLVASSVGPTGQATASAMEGGGEGVLNGTDFLASTEIPDVDELEDYAILSEEDGDSSEDDDDDEGVH